LTALPLIETSVSPGKIPARCAWDRAAMEEMTTGKLPPPFYKNRIWIPPREMRFGGKIAAAQVGRGERG